MARLMNEILGAVVAGEPITGDNLWDVHSERMGNTMMRRVGSCKVRPTSLVSPVRAIVHVEAPVIGTLVYEFSRRRGEHGADLLMVSMESRPGSRVPCRDGYKAARRAAIKAMDEATRARAEIRTAWRLLPDLAAAHAAALDELEQLRARNAKLEAVVAALPRCSACSSRPATLADQGPDGDTDFTCDICAPFVRARWEDERLANEREAGCSCEPLVTLTNLPWADALRALEKP